MHIFHKYETWEVSLDISPHFLFREKFHFAVLPKYRNSSHWRMQFWDDYHQNMMFLLLKNIWGFRKWMVWSFRYVMHNSEQFKTKLVAGHTGGPKECHCLHFAYINWVFESDWCRFFKRVSVVAQVFRKTETRWSET